MKITITLSIITLLILRTNVSAQQTSSSEVYSHTLNLGIGIGYYGYADHSIPVLHANYELNAGKDFTLAPFISFYSFKNGYYWGDNKKNYPYKNYYYSETDIQIGVKGSYYFDRLIGAGSNWDFYLAGSLGFTIIKSSWDNDYYGDRDYYNRSSSLYLDLHIGTEYHINSNLGIYLDLSSGVSTVGIAIH